MSLGFGPFVIFQGEKRGNMRVILTLEVSSSAESRRELDGFLLDSSVSRAKQCQPLLGA